MGLENDLAAEVNKIIKGAWTTSEGTTVPDTPDIALGNNGTYLDATCLYADMAESTALVSSMKLEFAAEMYKCFLNCCCRIIKNEGGVVTAFDGDRVMAVFIGDSKNSNSARTALSIDYAVNKIINPSLTEYYGAKLSGYVMRHAVGIDTGKILVARTGIRGANDLVWVGKSANIAAKLCSRRNGNYTSWITKEVHGKLHTDISMLGVQSIWEPSWWAEQNCEVYRSSWHRNPG